MFQRGASQFELILVLVVVTTLMGITISQYIRLHRLMTQAQKQVIGANIHTTFLQFYTNKKRYPSVKELNNQIFLPEGKKSMAVPVGIEINILKDGYFVPTYKELNCRKQTTDVKDIVKCVGYPTNS